MHLSALNSKSEPESELVSEFSRKFSNEPPEAIQAAFRAWRDISPFFPTIADIAELLFTWHRLKAEEYQAQQQAAEKQKITEAREKGELVEFTDILKQLDKTVGKMPEPPHIQRQRKSRPTTSPTIPSVQLTKEQIDARREKEREEIKRAEEA